MERPQQLRSPRSSSKVYVVCLNPFCTKQRQRCMDSKQLQNHPQQCCHHFFPADVIINNDWKKIQNYPSDSLGQSVKVKYEKCNLKSFLNDTVQQLRKKLQKSINQLQKRLHQLYPSLQLDQFYSGVYNLQKVAQGLQMNRDPTYISNIINNNFLRPKYNALLLLNQSYDDVKNMVDNLYVHMNQHIDDILKKHKSYQQITKTKTVKEMRKIKYDLVKSRFISSSGIQVNRGEIQFPKVKNVSSFLPWLYGEKFFNQGIHQIKISSVRFPLVQNSGFTVLQEQDSDTYPYTHFKSLFNRQGRGFKLVKGENIQTHISKSTVIVLRMQLDTNHRALIYDSEMKSIYECPLKPETNYRLGIYGAGWSIILLELS